MRKNKSIKFNELVEDMFKPVFKKRGFANLKVLSNWEDIVGKTLASICLPDKISSTSSTNGTLFILIEQPAFTLEIQAKEASIINRVNMFLGYNAINRIRISVAANSNFFRKEMLKQNHSFTKKNLPKSDQISEELHFALQNLYSTFE